MTKETNMENRKFIKGRKPQKKVPMRKDGRGEKL
jgi:hypothetical protein